MSHDQQPPEIHYLIIPHIYTQFIKCFKITSAHLSVILPGAKDLI
jgi:hypothetical protein